jgi:hypothetical protein
LAPPSCLAIVFQTVFQLALLGDKSSLQFEHLPVKNSCHLRKIGCLVGDYCYWFRCPYSGLSAFHPQSDLGKRWRDTHQRTGSFGGRANKSSLSANDNIAAIKRAANILSV